MAMLSTVASAALAAALAAAPADAQPEPATVSPAPAPTVPDDQEAAAAAAAIEATANEIVVIASRLAGQVETDQAPILELDEEAIASYGAGSIQDLLTALAPQTGSGRGRGGGGGFPVVLLNGQRVSGFREMRNIPPEAIRRMEVLPEEVALQYGFRPDQRVVNFILKPQFAAFTAEAEIAAPQRGDYHQAELEGSLFKIAGKSRINLTANVADASPLTEAERGIVQPAPTTAVVAGDPDPAAFRTLLPDTRTIGANGTFARPLDRLTDISLNAAAEKRDSRSLFGLNAVTLTAPGGAPVARAFVFPAPLRRDSETIALSAGGAANRQLGDWRLSLTADYNQTDSRTRTDRRADAAAVQAAVAAGLLAPTTALPTTGIATFAADRAKSDTDTLTTLATLSGRPFRLPAGEAALTVKAGYEFRGIESSDTRNPGVPIDLSRNEALGGFNLQLPIASRREDVLAAIGDLSLNLNGELNRLSDFGRLTGYGAGLTWSPTGKLSLQASYVAREAAPSLSDLGGPVLVTPNVTVFDFSRGETVLVNVASGGNPGLLREKQRDLKLGVNWQLPFLERSNFVAEYFRNRSYDTTNGFPLLTPAIEAAFPGRVTRDAGGRLVAIDQRPVTFAAEKSERIRYGFNLGGAFGKARAVAQPGGGAMPAVAASPPPAAAASPGGEGTASPPGEGRRGFGGGFNREAFAQLRARYCAADAPAGVPTGEELANLPERMAARLRRPDGSIDPEAWAQFRTRLCSGDGQARGGGRFDPEAFARLRQQHCAPGAASEPPGPDALAALPERMAARLRRPDGTIDPEAWKTFRERLCSGEGFGRGRGAGGGSGEGQPQPQPGQDAQRPQGFGGQGGGFGRGFGGGGIGGGPGGGGGPRMGGRGGMMGGGGGDGRGRWNLSLFHTVRFAESVRIAAGGPVLDLLDGDALSGGGVARHALELEGGGFYRGFGFRLTGAYTGGTRIDGSALTGSSRLDFHPIATFDLRMFANLGQQERLVKAAPFFRNSRVSLRVDNLFDAQQRVTDAGGEVPLRYQPGFLDPAGRLFEIEFRKQF